MNYLNVLAVPKPLPSPRSLPLELPHSSLTLPPLILLVPQNPQLHQAALLVSNIIKSMFKRELTSYAINKYQFFFESSIFLEMLSYSFVKYAPCLQVGWPSPAPPMALNIKAVYVVFY